MKKYIKIIFCIGLLTLSIIIVKYFKFVNSELSIFRIASIIFFIFSLSISIYTLLFIFLKISKHFSITKIAYVICFGILFLIPFIFSICSSNGNIVNSENRNISKFPHFEIAHFSRFLPGIILYINDNFGGRSELIECNKILKKRIFNTKDYSNKTVAVADNWMFYNPHFVKSYHINSLPLTEDQLKDFAINQLELQAWLKLQNIDYYLFLPPSAMTIYPEKLPNWYKQCYQYTKREQIINYLKLHTDIKVIVVDSFLKSKKKQHQLYFKTDSHWNYFGAYYAYEYLINTLRINHPNIPAISHHLDDNKFEPRNFTEGDLLKMAGILGEYSEPDTIISPPKTNYKYKGDKYEKYVDVNIKTSHDPTTNYLLKTKHNSLNTAPNLVMYRDSYLNAMLTHLPNHFNKATFLWDIVIKPEFRPEQDTDIFIYEVTENQMNGIKKTSDSIKEEVKNSGIKIHFKN